MGNYLKPILSSPVAYQVWAVLRGGPFFNPTFGYGPAHHFQNEFNEISPQPPENGSLRWPVLLNVERGQGVGCGGLGANFLAEIINYSRRPATT